MEKKFLSLISRRNDHNRYVIIMLMCVLFSCSCGSENRDINRGHRFFDRGNFEYAIKNYSFALKSNPSNPETYFFRGLTYLRIRDLDSAVADFTSAISLDPAYVNAYVNRGSIWKEKGEIDKALLDYNKVIELKPDDYSSYLVRADLWFRKQKYDNAIADYSIVIEKNFKAQEAYIGRADAYYHKLDYGNAIKDCYKAIEINPENSFAYNNLAWILSTCTDDKYRDGKMALKYAKKAVELNPSQYNLHTYAAAYAENMMFDDAIRIMKEILRNDKGANDDFEKHLKLFQEHQPLREIPNGEPAGTEE